MKMDIKRIEEIAHASVNSPWGCGDKLLERNGESCYSYYRFLNAMVKEYRPEAVIECGVYLGTGSMHMATANPDTMVIAIDNVIREQLEINVQHYPNIWLIDGDSTSAETYQDVEMILDGRKVGLIFLDSQHDGDTPWNEFNLYEPLFADECLVCCDDVLGGMGDPATMLAMFGFWQNMPGEKLLLPFLHLKHDPNWPYDPGFAVSIVRRNSKGA